MSWVNAETDSDSGVKGEQKSQNALLVGVSGEDSNFAGQCQDREWMGPFWDCHDEDDVPPVYSFDKEDISTVSSSSSQHYFDEQDFRGWKSSYIQPMGLIVFLSGLAVVAHPIFWIAGALTALSTAKACMEDDNICDGEWFYNIRDEENRAALEAGHLKAHQGLSRNDVSEVTYDYGGSPAQQKKLLAIEAGPPLIPFEEEDKLKTVDGDAVDNAIINQCSDPRALKTPQESLTWVNRFYPPLSDCAKENITLVGLNALDFFNVFFATDAPFTFEELQRKRHDKDIHYGQWEKLKNVKQASLHPESCRDLNLSMQERLLQFKTKTNSFFGPPYADATKSQRALVVSKRLLVLEATTTLKEVPFCERFYIMERWVVTAEKREDFYHASLSIYFEVIFVESCPFASQIVSSSKKTFLEIANTWESMALEALKLTEKARSKRLERSKNTEMPSSITTAKEGQRESAIELRHEGKRKISIIGDDGVTYGVRGKARSTTGSRRMYTFRHGFSKMSMSKLVTKIRTTGATTTSPTCLTNPTTTSVQS